MSALVNAITVGFTTVGTLFFVAGMVGLLRFPDVHTRLHALTKADNLGLGLIVLGLAPQADDIWSVLKLLIVWLLTVLAAATVSQLIARSALPPLSSERRSGA